eukprot:SAG31_NODE_6793_length_1885_cov_3.047032_2_plen_259_part_00
MPRPSQPEVTDQHSRMLTWRVSAGRARLRAKALQVLHGDQSPRKTQRLSSYQKKFITFALALHTPADPLFPLFPVSLTTLMEFATWCSENGVNGWDSISNYVGAVVTWHIRLCNMPDPRSASPLSKRDWDDFVRHFPVVIGNPPSKVKLRIQPAHLVAIHRDLQADDWWQARDWCAYSLCLWYTTCRIGHVAPDAADAPTLDHALRWNRIQFEPSLHDPLRVLLFFPSTKTRPVKANRPWFTAVDALPQPEFCFVRWL